MNIQEVLFVSGMATIFGLGLFVCGMFLSKNRVLRILGISIMVIAMTAGWTASSFVIQTALQETQAQK
jgi:hypothetical protein